MDCVAESIDGVLDTSMCGCTDCLDHDHEEIERAVELGTLSEHDALREHFMLNRLTDDSPFAYPQGD